MANNRFTSIFKALLALLLPTTIFANPIPKDQLVALGQEAFRQKLYAIQEQPVYQEVKSYFFIEDNDNTYMAVLNFNQGFIIMAADDASIPVLAYAFEGEFTLENAAPGAKMFLEQYQKEITAIRNLQLPTAPDVAAAWTELKKPSTKGVLETIVAPLLSSTWNQTKFYNQFSPEDADSPSGYDGRVPNGCVAVAMAQIMYYYRYPTQGSGQHTNHTNYGNFTVNFDNETFNYEAMQDALSGYNTEVAKLIFDCATSVDMSYAPDGSGAYSENVPGAISTYFGYSTNATYANKWGTNNNQWRNYLKGDLNLNRPVYYSGFSDDGGHAFVCDGYNSDNYFHFNFGWGGTSNAFYALSNSDTYSDAVGGFSRSQSCIRNIYPASDYPYFCNNKQIVCSSGTLEDGSSDLNYQNNQECMYVITDDNAYQFSVQVNRFNTQADHDSLSFWDGHPSQGHLLNTISGNLTNQPSYNFYTDSLYITFRTDDSITDAGWHLSYIVFRDLPNCTTGTFHDAAGTIADGSGDSQYRANANCNWTIRISNAQTITLTFDEFDLSPEDHLNVYDLSQHNQLAASFSGHNLPDPVTFYTNKIRVSFISDNYLHGDGFLIHWEADSPNAIEEHTRDNNLTLTPNPANNFVTIYHAKDNTSIQIIDLSGKVIKASTSNSTSTVMNVGDLKNGIYMVRIMDSNSSTTKKLVVTH